MITLGCVKSLSVSVNGLFAKAAPDRRDEMSTYQRPTATTIRVTGTSSFKFLRMFSRVAPWINSRSYSHILTGSIRAFSFVPKPDAAERTQSPP